MIKDGIESWEDNKTQQRKDIVDLEKIKWKMKNSLWNKNCEQVKQQIRHSQRKN